MKKLCVLLALLLLVGCAPAAVVPPPETAEPVPSQTAQTATPPPPSPAQATTPPFVFTAENFPRIDGSTANIPLIEAVTSVLLGVSRSTLDVSVAGTDDAYRLLAGGECDVLLVYEMSPSTARYFEENDVKLDLAPIGRDALVFLVNRLNPLSGLSAAQLRGIYGGDIADWSAVGGAPGEIVAYQRQTLSGSQTMMQKLVMGDIPMMGAPAMYAIGDMGSLVQAVAEYDNAARAIGYNVFYYVTNMKLDERIKLLDIDGVTPTADTIRSGAYPFVNDFYVVIRADEPEGSPARVLYEWMQSAHGQLLVDHEGYVAINK